MFEEDTGGFEMSYKDVSSRLHTKEEYYYFPQAYRHERALSAQRLY